MISLLSDFDKICLFIVSCLLWLLLVRSKITNLVCYFIFHFSFQVIRNSFVSLNLPGNVWLLIFWVFGSKEFKAYIVNSFSSVIDWPLILNKLTLFYIFYSSFFSLQDGVFLNFSSSRGFFFILFLFAWSLSTQTLGCKVLKRNFFET